MQQLRKHLRNILKTTLPFDWKTALVALLAIQGSGCGTISYYRQAAAGQWQIERSKRSIRDLKQSKEINAALKEKFERIEEIRRYAFWHLGLPAEDAYDTYVELERDYVVWNVTACPEFSMEPHRWWYPFLGRLKYRGYFDKDDADQYARAFTTRGYDVAVEGVVAYSTLGWFRDPVFDTFMSWSDRAIAELLFHELAHQKVFLSGKTEWNDAFAVVTARAAVRQWLDSQSHFEELETYESEIALEEVFIRLVLETKHELEKLYGSFERDNSARSKPGTYRPEASNKAQLKKSVFESLRHRFDVAKLTHPSLSVYDGWMSRPLNNARLTSIDTYYQWVPMFEALQQQYGGDWEGFFNAVEQLDNDPPSEES